MFVRMTYFKPLPLRVKDFLDVYNEEIIPVVKQQKGFVNIMLLKPIVETDDYISMTQWESQADAETYEFTGVYKKLVEKAKGFFQHQPVLKLYNAALTSGMHLYVAG